jgi:hypothetical protein
LLVYWLGIWPKKRRKTVIGKKSMKRDSPYKLSVPWRKIRFVRRTTRPLEELHCKKELKKLASYFASTTLRAG